MRTSIISEAKREANARYDAKATRGVYLKLNLKTDADILACLDRVANRQGFIKALIRAYIREYENGAVHPMGVTPDATPAAANVEKQTKE